MRCELPPRPSLARSRTPAAASAGCSTTRCRCRSRSRRAPSSRERCSAPTTPRAGRRRAAAQGDRAPRALHRRGKRRRRRPPTRAARVAKWVNRGPRPRQLAAERAHARAASPPSANRARRAEPHASRRSARTRSTSSAWARSSAVGRASANEPRLIVLRYEPPHGRARTSCSASSARRSRSTRAGISLKPALKMEDMKGDMAGGAGGDRRICAIADLGLPCSILAVVAAAENIAGGGAFRPGDILRPRNGKTIEITNTDAEGRLVLADALWYAREQGATHVLDLATLTGAMELALGDLYAGMFANDEEWRRADPRGRRGERRPPVAAAAPPALPPLRRLRVRRHEELVRLRQGSPVLAAEFLQRVRRRRAVGAPRHRRARLPRALARRLPVAARRHGLRRPADRRARPAPRRLNFDLDQGARARPRDRARVRAGARRAARRGARPREPLPVRARRGARPSSD